MKINILANIVHELQIIKYYLGSLYHVSRATTDTAFQKMLCFIIVQMLADIQILICQLIWKFRAIICPIRANMPEMQ